MGLCLHRCIKPNDQQVADKFSKSRVMDQLKYNGVTEVARIKSVGFRYRFRKNEFKNR